MVAGDKEPGSFEFAQKRQYGVPFGAHGLHIVGIALYLVTHGDDDVGLQKVDLVDYGRVYALRMPTRPVAQDYHPEFRIMLSHRRRLRNVRRGAPRQSNGKSHSGHRADCPFP
jgi:hypothetical protein